MAGPNLVDPSGSHGRVAARFGSGDERTRTADPLLAKQVLYQLSYVPAGLRDRLPDNSLGPRLAKDVLAEDRHDPADQGGTAVRGTATGFGTATGTSPASIAPRSRSRSELGPDTSDDRRRS
jgi:hypothetical protein